LYIGLTFLPRLIASGAIALLALSIMGALKQSDYFLLPIILYATLKEFGVRSILLNTDREKLDRPKGARLWIGEVLLFVFIVVAYVAIWKVYLLETPHVMYIVLSPINWGFAAAAFFLIIYCFEMPYFWEEYLHDKSAMLRWMSIASVLLPVLGLLGRFFLILEK